MAVEIKTGPLIVTGNQSPVQNRDWEQGPSLFADGTALTDDRLVGITGAASQKAYGLNSADYVLAVDGFPITLASNNVVAAQGAGQASGFSLPLASGTVQSAVSNVPIVPWVLSTDNYGNRQFIQGAYTAANVVTAGLALDFGMCAGTTFTSSTVTLSSATGLGFGTWPPQYAAQTVNKSQIVQLQTTNQVQPENMFTDGQWIIVANAGNAGATIPLLAQVLAVDYINHYLYINTPALAAVTNGGIANANPPGLGTANGGIAAWPWEINGAIYLLDPRQMLSRALSYVSSSVSDTTVTVTVSGWDVYGVPMTETITLNGTTTVNGKKAFKFIKSAVTGVASLVGNVSIGTQDVVGLNLRVDAFSYLQLAYNDAFVTANTGFTKADLSVASATTGDVRGTYALQSASNGSKRIAIYVNPTQYQWSQGTNLTPQMAFGMSQF